jgi:hypothetical protein
MLVDASAGLTRHVGTAKTMGWTAAVAAVWLMIALFLLGPSEIAAGRWNDIIVGAIVFILGVWAALASPRAAG